MPKSKTLSEVEIAQIEAYNSTGKSTREIGALIGRSNKVVWSYLRNPELYKKKKKRGTTTKLSPQDARRICRVASNSTLSSSAIVKELGLQVTPSRVRQILNNQDHLTSAKMKTAPRLKPIHIQSRLNFAKNNMDRAWNLVGT